MSDTARQTDGLDALALRVERGKRNTPPPRHPRPTNEIPGSPTSSGANVPPGEPVLAETSVPEERGRDLTKSDPNPPLVVPQTPKLGISAVEARSVEPTKELASSSGPRTRSDAAKERLFERLGDAPTTMLGARVRQPLDDLLTDLVHDARSYQVRTSKVELVELALVSLAGLDGKIIAEQVREFRSRTGRFTGRR